MEEEKLYLCIDVGGSSIKFGVMDAALDFKEKGSIPTPHEGLSEYLEALVWIYRRFSARICAIAMSVPGIIDGENGICITGGNLEFIEDFPLAAELEKRCRVSVTVMNDAKCAAMAEASWGTLKNCRDGIVLVLGTGLGGALVKDGKVHMGRHFAAGEFSFVMMGKDCDMGQNQWADYIGNKRLITMASRARGVSSEHVSGYDVFQWANEGDDLVLEVLNQFTKEIAFVVMNLQMIYDPECFAIGGGISRQPLLLQYIRKNLDYYYRIYPKRVPKAQVVPCRFFNDANLIGALGFYLKSKDKI